METLRKIQNGTAVDVLKEWRVSTRVIRRVATSQNKSKGTQTDLSSTKVIPTNAADFVVPYPYAKTQSWLSASCI